VNIFVLDSDPRVAARSLCGKHVGKMLIESTQILCTNLLLSGVDPKLVPYKKTHANHPCTKWARECDANANWLLQHALELADEFKRRFGKTHKTSLALGCVVGLLPHADWRKHTQFVTAMPQEWKTPEDPVTSYRCYYVAEKSVFAKWAPHVKPPSWWPFGE
jgi:hypothetical protein